MAKKSKTPPASGVSSSISSDFGMFLKEQQPELLINFENYNKLKTGLDLLDTIIGGGARMKFNQIVGQSGGGKSLLMGHLLKTNQELYGKKFISIYFDTEESVDARRLSQLGVPYPDHVNLIRHTSLEKIFSVIESLCVYKESNPETLETPSLIIWDSIANTHLDKTLKTEDKSGETDAMIFAKEAKRLLKKYIPLFGLYNITCISINQLNDEIDMDGKFSGKQRDLRFLKNKKQIPGGASVRHNSYLLLGLRQTKEHDETLMDMTASSVELVAIKNKEFTPNIKIELICNYRDGFHNFWTNVFLLKNHKYMTAGAWCYLNSCPDIKFRHAKAYETYLNNEKFKEHFDADVKDCLYKNYVVPYGYDEEKKLEIEKNEKYDQDIDDDVLENLAMFDKYENTDDDEILDEEGEE